MSERLRLRRINLRVHILLPEHVGSPEVIHAFLQAVQKVLADLLLSPIVRWDPIPIESRASTCVRESDTVLPRNALPMLSNQISDSKNLTSMEARLGRVGTMAAFSFMTCLTTTGCILACTVFPFAVLLLLLFIF
jgi:hypothetical protein